MRLVKLLMGNPKSYAIWEFRVWIINIGLDLERQYIAAMIEAKKKAAAEKAAVAAVVAEQEEAKAEAAAAGAGETDNLADGDKPEDEPKLINMPGQEADDADDDKKWRSAILDNELKLCSKMLV